MLSKAVPLILFVAIGLGAWLFRHEIGALLGVRATPATAEAAAFAQGMNYVLGKGVAADPQKAMQFFRTAAQADYAPAEREIGYLYAEGLGLAADPQKAHAWYLLAAEQGDGLAMAGIIRQFVDADIGLPEGEFAMWLVVCAEHAQESEVRDMCARTVQTFPKQFPSPTIEKEFTEGKRLATGWKVRPQGSKQPNL